MGVGRPMTGFRDWDLGVREKRITKS